MNLEEGFALRLRGLFGSLAVMASLAAHATLIDFENLPNSNSSFTLHGDSVVSNGFRFSSTTAVGDPEAIASWGSGMSLYTGSVAIFANYINDSLKMERVCGGSFDVTSMGLADVFRSGTPRDVILTGTRADTTTVVHTFTLTNGMFMTDYNVGMSGLVSLLIDDGPDSSVQIDNVLAVVPEPATTLGVGVGLAALSRRARRRAWRDERGRFSSS